MRLREKWRAETAGIDPESFVFIDESGVTTDMTRLYGRARPGQRIHEGRLTVTDRPEILQPRRGASECPDTDDHGFGAGSANQALDRRWVTRKNNRLVALSHFGTREKLPTPTHQKVTNNPTCASKVLRLTAARHRRAGPCPLKDAC